MTARGGSIVVIVVMGVAGCGKSTVGLALAQALSVPFVDGDDFHAPASIDRMRRGEPLDDADRADWLDRLADELRARPHGVVLACSALKKRYRDRLRRVAPGLRFVYLRLDPDEARRRVAHRGARHFFAAGLVDDQFAALESPEGEAGVATVDATWPVARIVQALTSPEA